MQIDQTWSNISIKYFNCVCEHPHPIQLYNFVSKVCCYGLWLTHTVVLRNQKSPEVISQNMQSNRWPFKSQAFLTVHWALNSGAKELIHQSHTPVIRIPLNGWICLSEICFAALPNHVYLLDHPVYLSSSK